MGGWYGDARHTWSWLWCAVGTGPPIGLGRPCLMVPSALLVCQQSPHFAQRLASRCCYRTYRHYITSKNMSECIKTCPFETKKHNPLPRLLHRWGGEGYLREGRGREQGRKGREEKGNNSALIIWQQSYKDANHCKSSFTRNNNQLYSSKNFDSMIRKEKKTHTHTTSTQETRTQTYTYKQQRLAEYKQCTQSYTTATGRHCTTNCPANYISAETYFYVG